ncbi:MAG: hypothetical protein ABGW84_13020 [Sphingomonadaceae bacterium]
MTGLLVGCVPDAPGREIDNASDYYGCYQLIGGEIVELSEERLAFPSRGKSFAVSYYSDKRGDLAAASPPLRFAGRSDTRLSEAEGEGTFLRFDDGDLLIPHRDGGKFRATATRCDEN